MREVQAGAIKSLVGTARTLQARGARTHLPRVARSGRSLAVSAMAIEHAPRLSAALEPNRSAGAPASV